MKNQFDHLKKRTQQFAVNIIRLMKEVPDTEEGRVIRHQLIRSATSVGANYRAACRARSVADFVSKITVVEEEADESVYWLELIELTQLLIREQVEKHIKEGDELTAIFSASGRTAKQRRYAK